LRREKGSGGERKVQEEGEEFKRREKGSGG